MLSAQDNQQANVITQRLVDIEAARSREKKDLDKQMEVLAGADEDEDKKHEAEACDTDECNMDSDDAEEASGRKWWIGQAHAGVNANVTLFETPLTDQDSEMQRLIKSTVLTTMTAEQLKSQDSKILIYYDEKLAAEASCQPATRRPPSRDPLRDNCLRAVMALFHKELSTGQLTLRDDFIILMPDNNKHMFGAKRQQSVWDAFSMSGADGSTRKPELTHISYMLTYDEDALRMQRATLRQATFVDQTETLHMLYGKDTKIKVKARSFYKGTTHGKSWIGLELDPLRADDAFLVPKWKKADILGSARCLVGGPSSNPESAEAAVEDESADMQPISYWSSPKLYYQDILQSYDIVQVLDFTAGDGKFAKMCLNCQGKVKYVGFCHSEAHKDLLHEHLCKWYVGQMSKEDSPLYSADVTVTRYKKDADEDIKRKMLAPEETPGIKMPAKKQAKTGEAKKVTAKVKPAGKGKKASAKQDQSDEDPHEDARSSPPPEDSESD